MNEPNAAALLREDTLTVKVLFQGQTQPYTYVATKAQNLKVGDKVVVPTKERLTVAEVVALDADLDIAPRSDTTYRWVVCKVDETAYAADMERNRRIEEHLKQAYVNNAREAFRRSLGLEGDALRNLLGGD